MTDIAYAPHTAARVPWRQIAGYAAIAATLPYIVIKITWLTGNPVGLNEKSLVDDSSMVALNVLTFAMDLTAVIIALALTQRWGLRLPAWLVAFPVWVGTGFLAPIAIGAPLSTAVDALRGTSPVEVGGPVQSWVYAVVYTGFVCQGLALMTAFVLYARERWADLLRSGTSDEGPGATHGLQVVLANGTALVVLVIACIRLGWGLGGTIGLPASLVGGRSLGFQINSTIFGLMAIAAAAGLLMLVHGRGSRTPFWVPLTMTWVGAASMFSWGLWSMITTLPETVLSRGPAENLSMMNLTDFIQLLAAMVIGLTGAFLLAERSARRTPA